MSTFAFSCWFCVDFGCVGFLLLVTVDQDNLILNLLTSSQVYASSIRFHATYPTVAHQTHTHISAQNQIHNPIHQNGVQNGGA